MEHALNQAIATALGLSIFAWRWAALLQELAQAILNRR
jgi:hypothetical protein